MTFSHPWVLLGLAVPVLLGLWELRREGLRVALPFDYGDSGGSRWLGRAVDFANLLPAALLAVALLVLAAPKKPGMPREIRELTNIELCLDVSGSMNAALGEGSRYDAAMGAIADFTTQREGDAFALTIFGNEVLRWVPLTKDLSAIQNATPFLHPRSLPRHFGGTEIGKGLRYCRDTLIRQEEGDKLIILLSDGASADLRGDGATQLGNELADQGIVLYSIYMGTGTATQQLYDVTRPTGGEVFSVDDADGLHAVFAHIDKMRPARMKPSAAESVDDYRLYAILGLALLSLYLLTLFGLRHTPW